MIYRNIHTAYDLKEAIASELAGDLFYERGSHLDSYALYMHSIKCFGEWGALLVTLGQSIY